MKRTLVGVVAAAAWALVMSSVAFAGTSSLSCTTTITGTVSTNVVVPSGATCAVSEATINGNVSVAEGAGLFVTKGVLITGNLEAASGAGVLLGEGVTLKGSYGAVEADSAILGASLLGKNVSFTGGLYGLLGTVTANLECAGGTTGATTATTVGGKNAGCTVGDLPTAVGAVDVAADKAGGGTKEKLTCKQAVDVASIYASLAAINFEVAKATGSVGAALEAAKFQGKAEGVIEASCGSTIG